MSATRDPGKMYASGKNFRPYRGVALIISHVRAISGSLQCMTAVVHCAVSFDQHIFDDIEDAWAYICSVPHAVELIVACLYIHCLLMEEREPYSCDDTIMYLEMLNCHSHMANMSRLQAYMLLKGPEGTMAYPKGFASADDPGLLHPIPGPSLRAACIDIDACRTRCSSHNKRSS